MQYWLVKTEPEEYGFNDLVKDKKAVWDGIRNYQARNNLKKMKKGDLVLVYHTGTQKQIVGIAKVKKEYYPDPTDKTNIWVAVELEAKEKLKTPFTLDQIKKEKRLSKLPLLKQGRLSVMPIKKEEFDFIVLYSVVS